MIRAAVLAEDDLPAVQLRHVPWRPEVEQREEVDARRSLFEDEGLFVAVVGSGVVVKQQNFAAVVNVAAYKVIYFLLAPNIALISMFLPHR